MTPDRRVAEETQQATRPQAPVVVIGRHVRFLDVQPTVGDAEAHLAQHLDEDPAHEGLPPALPLDACDYYDGIVRPLQPVVRDGALTLELAPGDPRPELVRAPSTSCCAGPWRRTTSPAWSR